MAFLRDWAGFWGLRGLAALLPWFLPFYLVLPYAEIVPNFRGVIWVWETGYRPFWILLALVCLLSAISSVLIWSLNRRGLYFYYLGVALITLHVSYMAMTEKRHGLLVFIFILFSVAIFAAQKMKNILALPYYDSRRKWWESSPKCLPELRLEVVAESGVYEAKLTNLGSEGCFVFGVDKKNLELPQRIRIYKEDQLLLEGRVEVKMITWDKFGMGLKFLELQVDDQKDLTDHLFRLRRAGYEISL